MKNKMKKLYICVDTGETANNYANYLCTTHWKRFKDKYILEHGRICQICGCAQDGLELHHISYKNVGHESPNDVILLCKSCHDIKHKELSGKLGYVAQNSPILCLPKGRQTIKPRTTYSRRLATYAHGGTIVYRRGIVYFIFKDLELIHLFKQHNSTDVLNACTERFKDCVGYKVQYLQTI